MLDVTFPHTVLGYGLINDSTQTGAMTAALVALVSYTAEYATGGGLRLYIKFIR